MTIYQPTCNKLTLAKDGIHPEEEGQIIMSKMIAEQMK